MTTRIDPRSSNEGLWWVLFGAGGICAAVVVPPLILLLGLGPAWGVVPLHALDHARIADLVYHPLGILLVGATIVLPLCHAMYRLRHSLHDLQLGRDAVVKKACYVGAALVSLLAVVLWLMGVS
jgi:fumarate reductase subunit D